MMFRIIVRLFLCLLTHATLWSHAQGETCQSKEFPNQRGNQNQWSGYMNLATPAECIDFCCASSSCVAVDYETVNSGCYIFSTPTELTRDASYSYYQVYTVAKPATTTSITTTDPTSTTASTTTDTTTLTSTTTTTSTTPITTLTSTTRASATTSSTATTFTTAATKKPVTPEKSPEPYSTTAPQSSTPDPTTTPTTEFSSPLLTEVLCAEQTDMDAGIHTASTGVVAAAVTSTTLVACCGITLVALLLHGARRKRRQRHQYVPKTVSSAPDLFTVSDKPSVTATNYTIYRGYNHFFVSTENISIKQLPERAADCHHDHHHQHHQQHHHQHHQ